MHGEATLSKRNGFEVHAPQTRALVGSFLETEFRQASIDGRVFDVELVEYGEGYAIRARIGSANTSWRVMATRREPNAARVFRSLERVKNWLAQSCGIKQFRVRAAEKELSSV